MKPLLEAQKVTKIFGSGFMSKGGFTAVRDASLTIYDDRPSITAIAGESGSGKTTLARMLLGIIQPSEGQILYGGRPVNELKGQEKKDLPARGAGGLSGSL